MDKIIEELEERVESLNSRISSKQDLISLHKSQLSNLEEKLQDVLTSLKVLQQVSLTGKGFKND